MIFDCLIKIGDTYTTADKGRWLWHQPSLSWLHKKTRWKRTNVQSKAQEIESIKFLEKLDFAGEIWLTEELVKANEVGTKAKHWHW